MFYVNMFYLLSRFLFNRIDGCGGGGGEMIELNIDLGATTAD